MQKSTLSHVANIRHGSGACPITCHVCTGLEDQRGICKLASSHLQDRSQQVQEIATISEPRARCMIIPACNQVLHAFDLKEEANLWQALAVSLLQA